MVEWAQQQIVPQVFFMPQVEQAGLWEDGAFSAEPIKGSPTQSTRPIIKTIFLKLILVN